jgi:hypothetical protein
VFGAVKMGVTRVGLMLRKRTNAETARRRPRTIFHKHSLACSRWLAPGARRSEKPQITRRITPRIPAIPITNVSILTRYGTRFPLVSTPGSGARMLYVIPNAIFGVKNIQIVVKNTKK